MLLVLIKSVTPEWSSAHNPVITLIRIQSEHSYPSDSCPPHRTLQKMAHISFSQLRQPRLANIMNIQGSFAQQTSGPQTLRVTKASLICDVDTAPDAVTARGLGAGLGSCAEVLCFHHFPNYSVTRVTRPPPRTPQHSSSEPSTINRQSCTITEKAPTSAFTFKTLLRNYA